MCIFFDILKIPKLVLDLYPRVIHVPQFLVELFIKKYFFRQIEIQKCLYFHGKKTYPSRLKKINNNQDILLTLDFPFILHISKEHMKNFDDNNK